MIKNRPVVGPVKNVLSELITDTNSPNLPKESVIPISQHAEVRRVLWDALEQRLGRVVLQEDDGDIDFAFHETLIWPEKSRETQKLNGQEQPRKD